MKRHFKTMQGFTLVELMVAMLLGLFLTAIIAGMYLSSKQAFTTTTQVSRAQESLRFATSFLKRDIRMAGYTECSKTTAVNSTLQSPALNTSGVFGWEFTGTDVNDPAYTLGYSIIQPDDDVAAARASNAGTAGQWTSLGSTGLSSIVFNNQPLAGSDVIAVTQDQKLPLTLTVGGMTSTTNRVINTSIAIDGLADVGTILKVGDCNVQDKFQNSVASGVTLAATENISGGAYEPGNLPNATFTWSQLWQDDDSIYSEKTVIYYVGTGSSGLPALFRIESECGLSTDCASGNTPSEVVDGVESMQVLYGEDTDADTVANIYRSADNVTDFDNVVTVRVSLLIRSPDNAKQQIDTDDYVLADNITIDVPDQRYLRYITNDTIHLRNMGL